LKKCHRIEVVIPILSVRMTCTLLQSTWKVSAHRKEARTQSRYRIWSGAETAGTHDRCSARCGDLIIPHCRRHHARKAQRRVSQGEWKGHQSVRKSDHGGLPSVSATAGTSDFGQQWLSGNRLTKRVPEISGTRKTPPLRMMTARSCFRACPLGVAVQPRDGPVSPGLFPSAHDHEPPPCFRYPVARALPGRSWRPLKLSDCKARALFIAS
jgi:hypothetical protein